MATRSAWLAIESGAGVPIAPADGPAAAARVDGFVVATDGVWEVGETIRRQYSTGASLRAGGVRKFITNADAAAVVARGLARGHDAAAVGSALVGEAYRRWIQVERASVVML